ncbi:protein NinG [Salmonella enterica subsp. enterica serovar Choleraesuis]|nr:protein NinG [Salmonella enterica subsp. enterica serovar Choleraesuis]
MAKSPRRKCKVCRDWFYPQFDSVWWCCPDHGAIYALQLHKRQREKTQAKERRESRTQQLADRKAWRQRKAAVKPLKHWLDLTQRAVNDICRETALANGEGCISCGTKNANAWHAGHYRTTAAAGHLRFTRINIQLQCDVCNVHKSGNIELYRINLVRKVGEAAVQELENDNRTHRWTVEELADIRREARADLRQLKKGQGNDR